MQDNISKKEWLEKAREKVERFEELTTDKELADSLGISYAFLRSCYEEDPGEEMEISYLLNQNKKRNSEVDI